MDSAQHPTDSSSHDLVSSAQLLDEEQFWQLLADSLAHTNNRKDQQRYLVEQLQQLSPTDIIGFRLRTEQLQRAAYNDRLWCAAYILNGGCSDDGFEYFRNWLISRGKDVYYRAKANPDTLVEQIEEGETDGYEFESFPYVALDAFKAQTGKELYDYLDTSAVGPYPSIEFTWQEEEPASMKAICPRLFEAMWK